MAREFDKPLLDEPVGAEWPPEALERMVQYGAVRDARREFKRARRHALRLPAPMGELLLAAWRSFRKNPDSLSASILLTRVTWIEAEAAARRVLNRD